MNETKPAIGVIGLGKMGGPIAKKFAKKINQLTVYDANPKVNQEFENLGFKVAQSIENLSEKSNVIWIMVPDKVVDSVLDQLCVCITPKTVLIDGGNSYFKDSIRRAKELAQKKLDFLDCGTSGGLWGANKGFSLTIGGDYQVFKNVEEVFKIIAASNESVLYVGPSGAGHYVKMIHNGIEYALMEAYAEGFHLLHSGYYKDLDLTAISRTWQNGAIIRSWILQLINQILEEKGVGRDFSKITGSIGEHGTGRWTVDTAKEFNISVPVIEDALNIREESRRTGGNYATKLIALIRHKMGGHMVKITDCPQCNL